MNGTATTDYQAEQRSDSLMERYSRKVVFKLLSRIKYGMIVIQECEESHVFGRDESIKVHISVHSPELYQKVLFSGSIGAGESYVEGKWDVDNLTDLVRIMVLNMSLLDRMERGLALILHPVRLMSHLLRQNSRSGAKKNIVSHYDLGNEMYNSFLDDTMMYSSAVFSHHNNSLEQAAVHKLDLVCKKLQLKPSDTVIEIGSGWGGFAIHAAQNYGCKVTTTTISNAQYIEAKKRIAQAGLADRIEIVQQDYRDLTGKYDKLVSIEMIEAVGNRYLPTFFRKCGQLLKQNGVLFLQAITIADQKFNQYTKGVDFIQKHIFPGGCLLSNRKMLDILCDKTDMVVRSIEDFGEDYARTLQHWRNRFHQSFPSIQQYGYDDQFKRLWEFYLCYCEGGFLEKSISVVQLIATKPDNRDNFNHKQLLG